MICFFSGASDDLVSCATMLEVLRVMSLQREPLKHSIIFNFNGAEESVLQVGLFIVVFKCCVYAAVYTAWFPGVCILMYMWITRFHDL